MGKSVQEVAQARHPNVIQKSDRTDNTWTQKHINDNNHLIYKYNCKVIQVATYRLAEMIVQIWIDALYSSKKGKGA